LADAAIEIVLLLAWMIIMRRLRKPT